MRKHSFVCEEPAVTAPARFVNEKTLVLWFTLLEIRRSMGGTVPPRSSPKNCNVHVVQKVISDPAITKNFPNVGDNPLAPVFRLKDRAENKQVRLHLDGPRCGTVFVDFSILQPRDAAIELTTRGAKHGREFGTVLLWFG